MIVVRFNRHKLMSMETLKEIGSIVNELPVGLPDLSNKLYGLYDGYLYSDVLTLANNKISYELYVRLETVIKEVTTYPTLKL